MGLAIIRQLARLMGGDLVADGRPGHGCRFAFTAALLPAARTAGVAVAAAPRPGPSSPRILVIDDHRIGRQTLTLLLEPLGAVVSSASGAEQALALLAEQPFDLVLTDVTMQGIDGLECCRRLRAEPGPNQSTPVLAVTGRTEQADIQACLAAGINGCIAKPIDAGELYRAIEAALSAAEQEEAVA